MGAKSMKPYEKIFIALLLAFDMVIATNRLVAALDLGDKAPDFELDSTAGGKFKLSNLKRTNVLLNFYTRL
jgi:hypothetical protein